METKESTASRLANPYLDQIDPYIPGLTGREASERYGIPLDKIIKLSSNENPIGASPEALKAANCKLSELHRYPDARARALRHSIADLEGVSADNVIIGAGSSEIMSFIVRAFSKPGDTVISMDPSFTIYAEIATAEGRKPVFVPLQEDFSLNVDRMLAAITPDTRVIFLTRPNNPTSRLIPLEDVLTVALAASNAIVVSDEAYIEFAENYPSHTAVGLHVRLDNILVTRTFSKAYGLPNLRVGYAIGQAEAIDYLFKIKPKWNVGEVAQEAAIGALGDRAHLEKVLGMVREGREGLVQNLSTLPGLEVVPEPQGNFIMVGVRGAGYSAESFTEAMGKKGIIIRGDFHPDSVRISIGTPSDNEAVIEAAKELMNPESNIP